MNNNPSNVSKDTLKNRLERIREGTQQPQTSSTLPATIISSSQPSSESTSSHSPFITSAKTPNEKSPMSASEEQPLPFSQEEMRNSFKQSLNSHNSINNKEKFGFFVQQANEMFQTYEKEISELKAHLSSFQANKLVLVPAVSSISVSIGPSNEEKFNYKMKKMSEDDMVSLDEIRIQYNKKLSELFKENAALSTMIDKMSYEVVNALQEKIQEQSKLLGREKELKDKALLELRSMDSVFQQNSDMKESLMEKDKLIIDLNHQLTESKSGIGALQAEIASKAKMITALKEHSDSKVKKINEQSSQIDNLRIEVTKLSDLNKKREKEIMEKEGEIHLLFTDNVQWEDKYKLQSKEIENFKKWSLWDEDLLESYRKIETLQATLEAKKKELNELTEEHQGVKKLKEELEADLKKAKLNCQLLRSENDGLIITKLSFEKKMEKYADYDNIAKENASFKKELNSTIDKYESTLKTDRKNNEIQLQSLKEQHESEMKTTVSKHEKSQLEQSNIIEALECKLANYENDNKELTNQLDKKSQLLQNLKDVYDNMVKKLKAQEEKIQSLEKGEGTSSQKLIEPTKLEVSTGPKVYSTFDKSAFTKEILIDYIYILFLFESSVNIHHLLDSLLGNINAYMHTLFEKQTNPISILSELFQDLYFMSFDKLLEKKIKDNPKEASSFIVNFEQFDRETINDICEQIVTRNPLARFKDKKTLEEIEQLFTGKYEKSFDFDESLKDYLAESIIPVVSARIEKYDKIISDDVHTLVEMSLNNLRDGKIVLNEEEIYSFEHYFNQYKHIESNEDEDSLTVHGELKQSEAIDNICYRIKYNEPSSIAFINCFDKNSEAALSRIISTIMIYNSGLTDLTLKGNNLSGLFFKEKVTKLIKLLRDLKVLNVSSNNLTDEDFKLFCNQIKTLSIEELIVDGNNLTSSAGFYLADVLIKNQTLEVLSLNNNKITEKGLSTVLQILSNQNSSLTSLSIAANHLKKDDFVALGDYLSSNPALMSLDVSENTIDPQSANVLGVAFKKAKNLQQLKANLIGLNEISTPQFFNNLNESTITEIELDQNIFGDSGTIIFINKIKTCPSIKRVSLRKCEISPMFLALIAQTIKSNTMLEEINLEQNTFDEASLLSFCKVIESDSASDIVIKFTKSGISEKAIESMGSIKGIVLV